MWRVRTIALRIPCVLFCFFVNDTATTEIYTLSLHDALPISTSNLVRKSLIIWYGCITYDRIWLPNEMSFLVSSSLSVSADRKSTRLNSSHSQISYAVFCLKKIPTRISLVKYVEG